MARILVIGDVHEPATHPGYLAFCSDLAEEWDTDRVVFIGDLLDMHAASFHPVEPDSPGASDEADQAEARIRIWFERFPRANVCIGNHDARVHRLAASVRVPARFIRDYAKVWSTPGWKWKNEHTVDGTTFMHGTGLGGQSPALTAAKHSGLAAVACGHVHSVAGVSLMTSGQNHRTVWGLDTGCGVDVEHPAMNYGRNLFRKPVLAAGVILDRQPFSIAMKSERGGKYHRSRFKGDA